jgi:hypothetical protein
MTNFLHVSYFVTLRTDEACCVVGIQSGIGKELTGNGGWEVEGATWRDVTGLCVAGESPPPPT